jgi:hypothetical protein
MRGVDEPETAKLDIETPVVGIDGTTGEVILHDETELAVCEDVDGLPFFETESCCAQQTHYDGDDSDPPASDFATPGWTVSSEPWFV